MEECECMVCFSPVNETNDCQLTCKHPLCFGCLTKLNNNTCPMCRRSLSSKLTNIEKYLRTLDPKKEDVSQARRSQVERRQPRINLTNQSGFIFNGPFNTSYINDNMRVGNNNLRYVFNESADNSIDNIVGAVQRIDLSDDLPRYADLDGAYFQIPPIDNHIHSRTMTFNQESSLKLSIRYSQVIIQRTNEPNITIELTGDDLDDVMTNGNLITVTDFPVWESVIINIPNNINPYLNLNLSGRLDCKIDLDFLDASISNSAKANFQNINKAIINIGGLAKCSVENVLNDFILDAAGSSDFKAKSIKKAQINTSGVSQIRVNKIDELLGIQASDSSKIEIDQSFNIKAQLSGLCQLSISKLDGDVKLSCNGSSNVHVSGTFTTINNEASDLSSISTVGHCLGSCFLSATGRSKIIHQGKVDGEIKKVGSLMSMIYVNQ